MKITKMWKIVVYRLNFGSIFFSRVKEFNSQPTEEDITGFVTYVNSTYGNGEFATEIEVKEFYIVEH